jgi:GPH family glycoside/pentoside/hexuronide:cation symporter
MAETQPRSNLTLAMFAAPSLPFAALGLPLIVHLPAFYTQSMGLPLGAVGLMFVIARLLDIGADPFIGGAMDRTRTRFGRFKPWLAAAVPVMMLATYMLFLPPKGVGMVFLTFWLLVVYVTFSVVVLAQTSWGAVLSTNYGERSRVYGWWQFGNVVGILLVLLLPVGMGMLGAHINVLGHDVTLATDAISEQSRGVAAMGPASPFGRCPSRSRWRTAMPG